MWRGFPLPVSDLARVVKAVHGGADNGPSERADYTRERVREHRLSYTVHAIVPTRRIEPVA